MRGTLASASSKATIESASQPDMLTATEGFSLLYSMMRRGRFPDSLLPTWASRKQN